MLLSHLIIEPTLILLVFHLHLLLLDLFIKLLTNQSFPLLFSKKRLLLLLEMQERVELLDCRPLVVLVYLRVLFRVATALGRSNRVGFGAAIGGLRPSRCRISSCLTLSAIVPVELLQSSLGKSSGGLTGLFRHAGIG